MSQWDTSWLHQNALVTRTCTYFISEHCVSNAGMCNFVAAFGTRWWFIAAELSLARQLLLRQFDGTWTWARIFAFWRVAKVRYAYFGQWRAGETLCHILELYPWVFDKVIQMLVAFVMVETAFQQDWILFHRVHPCYMFRHRYYFQVFINTKKKNEKRILQYYFNVCVFH